MKRSSASSSSSPYGFLKEPSPDLFPSKEDIFRLFGVIAIAVSVAIACNYGVNVLNFKPKPFCDSHGTFEDLTPDFCEPCPKNGECINGNLECLHGYKKHGRSCVEDGEINQTAKKLSDLVKLRVCEAYVRFSCERIGTIWVQETVLWSKLDEHQMKENFGLKNESYAYSKNKAMEIIDSSLETRTDLRGFKELKCPDWLAEQYKPLSCHIRQWVYSHALVIVPVSALLVGIVTILILSIRRIRRSQYLSTRGEQLYHQVCEILEENAMAAKNVNGKSEPWVVASRLRDHLLLPKERRDPFLWKKVEELVQEDSRLDQYPKLVKGESKVVWEWQVDHYLSRVSQGLKSYVFVVEGSLSSSRKRLKEAERKLRISGHESPVPRQQTPIYRKLLNL